ncbi:NAD(P)/FAD-dependent oxidoreductase [Paenactinomyces guangxiensis]|uniref:NAD(P)/FAD-dependent oxidoreductase n=1 Tax=Paenactinomyces guangxiensis TaxID=1490290 RepID=A0A7W2A840_9BACL|nr:NAD(P)/FAD-dependent oxidoreductase [Paenactinomyces guangxiensis]MBA4493759.1 NAD(P)/FAD-dependent oxidoreductase [Paenactinomyces guangxiensis]MBH8591047.1 NAD(P)/FAD-dependent oxidoreductase [Paenactinomyces guangxiensis]
MSVPKIVILGAGYGGLMTAKGLQKELNYNEAEVTLVNQNSYHYITTKLHEPAAGTAHHDHARIAIEDVINTKKIKFIRDRVTSINLQQKEVQLEKGDEPLKYDYLVIGLGSAPETFGIKGLLENALFIRNIDSVRMIREHIEYMFARYPSEKKEELITIVVGGAGFTGIEYVGELVDRMPELCREYDIPLEKVRIVNIEAAPTVLPGFDKELVDYAVKYLESKGVEFLISTPIEECTQDGVIVKGGKEIKASTVVWTGGVRGNKLVEDSGIETMRGRVKVDEFLRAPGYDNVFVLGDSSLVFNEDGERPYPPTAQIATQQGQCLGKNLAALIRGGEMKPFKYEPKGTVASLGRKEAIGVVGNKKMAGGMAAFMKKVIDLRWLFLLGGVSLVLRKGKL